MWHAAWRIEIKKSKKYRPSNWPWMTNVRPIADYSSVAEFHLHSNFYWPVVVFPFSEGLKFLVRAVRIFMELPLTVEVKLGLATREDLTRLTVHEDKSHSLWQIWVERSFEGKVLKSGSEKRLEGRGGSGRSVFSNAWQLSGLEWLIGCSGKKGKKIHMATKELWRAKEGLHHHGKWEQTWEQGLPRASWFTAKSPVNHV